MRARRLSGFLIVPAAVALMADMKASLETDAEPRADVLTVLDQVLVRVCRNHSSEEIAYE